MRSWLNNEFLNKAFSSSEQSAIKTSTVINKSNSKYGIQGGNSTFDKVFLLSIDEVNNTSYGFLANSADDKARVRRNTAYVAAGGSIGASAMYSAGKSDLWWLRSPGNSSLNAAYVHYNGNLHQYGNSVGCYCLAVCPALHLNLSSSNCWSYAGTVSSNGTYTSGENSPVPDYKQQVNGNQNNTGTNKTDSASMGTISKKSVKTSFSTKPVSTKIKKIKKAKRSLKVKWKKVKNVKGYQLQYATNKKFKKAKKITIKKAKTTSKTIKKLKAKKKYYVRIRTYKVVCGKKVYSDWSKAKKQKTKGKKVKVKK